jgi:predicted nucleic acid-binding protein
MNLLLDTGILGQLCHPRREQNRPVVEWVAQLLSDASKDPLVFVPEIADYELRRKLLHLIHKGQAAQRSVDRLDELAQFLEYLPLDSETMRTAAKLWAEARNLGWPTTKDQALDGDVILASQALSVGGTVVTSNRKHLSRFVTAKDWTEISV